MKIKIDMRKILSSDELERKKMRNSKILVALMLLILAGSTAGYAFLSKDEQTNVDSSSQNQDGSGSFVFQGKTYSLINSLQSVSSLNLSVSKKISDYSGKKLYVDSDNDAVNYELSSTIGAFSESIQRGCYGPCEEDLPELDCNGEKDIIVWKYSEEDKIYERENCVFIEGSIRTVDAFIYDVFDIN